MKTPSTQDSVAFGESSISYHICFSSRATLGITVTPAMTVEVTAPKGSSKDRIRELVRKKARWIQRQQRFFLSFHPRPAPRQFRSGESHYYLGRQMLLKVRGGAKTGVQYSGRTLEVTAVDSRQAGSLVERWYRSKAKEKFPDLLAGVAERFARYGAQPSRLVIKRMPGRWGSCSRDGSITLHPDLIKAPRGCIEYVITHEMCHLVHRNHDRKFLGLQLKMMPDWLKWKNKLERLLA